MPSFPCFAEPCKSEPETDSGWMSSLDLRYTSQDGRTVSRTRHDGAIRVLADLYPEGNAVCHHVLVHPPGGLVGGDRIQIAMEIDPKAHALVTTPGATRFYRSRGAPAIQTVTARVHAGARLEWLPLESLAFNGCKAENRAVFELAAGSEMIGWDLLGLGLPASGQPFRCGEIMQHVEIRDVWMERGRITADDDILLGAPGGMDGQAALAALWFASGTPLAQNRAQELLEAARDVLTASTTSLALRAGATQVNEQTLVVRALASRIEPLQLTLMHVWSAWRKLAWDLQPCAPRVWRT